MRIPYHGIEDRCSQPSWSYLTGLWLVYSACLAFCFGTWGFAIYGVYRWISG